MALPPDPGWNTREGLSLTDARVAASCLAFGGLVALPTETVYGLGALATNESALARIFSVKGRPSDHPVIVHVAGLADAAQWADEVPPSAIKLAETFWPGPLTIVVERASWVPDSITGGQDTIALRSPNHPAFHAVLTALREDHEIVAPGIAAPSANRFGQVSPTTAAHVADSLGAYLGEQDRILEAGPSCDIGVESTIVLCDGDVVSVARAGGISIEQLREVVEVTDSTSDVPRVPGALASHYAPDAHVIVVEQISDGLVSRFPSAALIGLAGVGTPPAWTRVLAARNVEDYAHGLYSALRAADTQGLPVVVAVLPEAKGIGVAVRDRLVRASSNPV